jgi:uncharacterized UBP type Zn finger protein
LAIARCPGQSHAEREGQELVHMGESNNNVSAAGADLAVCEECLACAADGVIVRICISCGYVGCAEGSPGDHAFEHYAETDHPISAVIASGSVWCWSYPDGRAIQPPPLC